MILNESKPTKNNFLLTAPEIGPEILQNNHQNEELETIRDLITTIILKHQSHQWNTDSLWKKSS